MEYYSGTGVALGDMELREIVIESGRSMKKQWRNLTSFSLTFYLPFAICTSVLIYVLNDFMVRDASRFYASQQQTQPDPYGKPGNVPLSGNSFFTVILHAHSIVVSTLLSIIFVVCYYLLLASTILVVGAPFQSQGESQWTDQKTIFTASLDRAWRMLLTDILTFIILAFAIFLNVLIVVAVSMFSLKFYNITLAFEMIQLETILFMVWVIHFVLTVSLVRPIVTIERLWGKAAIKRSGALLRGRKLTAVTVLIFYIVCGKIGEILQTMFMLGPSWTLPVGFMLSVGTVIFVYLLVTTVGTVFYFSSRSVCNDQGLNLATFESIPQSASLLMKENGL